MNSSSTQVAFTVSQVHVDMVGLFSQLEKP